MEVQTSVYNDPSRVLLGEANYLHWGRIELDFLRILFTDENLFNYSILTSYKSLIILDIENRKITKSK